MGGGFDGADFLFGTGVGCIFSGAMGCVGAAFAVRREGSFEWTKLAFATGVGTVFALGGEGSCESTGFAFALDFRSKRLWMVCLIAFQEAIVNIPASSIAIKRPPAFSIVLTYFTIGSDCGIGGSD